MIVLRIFRALLGLVAVLQLIGLVPVITWLARPEAVTGAMLAMLTFKAVVAVLAIGGYAFLQGYINGRYARTTGRSVPLLRSVISL